MSKWSGWCPEKQEDPVSCNISCFLEFVSELFDSGLQYRTINVYRSARSVFHLPVDGSSVLLESRFMKGTYEVRPPQPRVFTTSDVGAVLQYQKKFHPTGTLSRKMLTLKPVMLSALVSARRCSYLYQFNLKYHYINNENFLLLRDKLRDPDPENHTWKFVFLTFLRIQLCAVSLIVNSILGRRKHMDQNLLVRTYCSCLTLNHVNL